MPVTPLLSMTGLHKWFGGVRALCNARMVLEKPGVVHALMGQNGSGKSTMLNILSGQLKPDEGTIALDGQQVTFHSPPAALAHGISMVSQETALAEDLSVAENVLLGHRLVRGRFGIDWAATQERARVVLEQVGVDYDPNCTVRTLRPDQKQMIEIARALSSNVKILVLDEPTSSLNEQETQSLFAVIRRLKEQGVSVIYVSHRLPEVFEIADEMTVLRDGITVDEGPKERFTAQSLVEAMVGAEKEVVDRRAGNIDAGKPPVLEIRGLTAEGALENVDLEVREGEILGLAGLVGSGRRELLEVIYGLRRLRGGHDHPVGGDGAEGWTAGGDQARHRPRPRGPQDGGRHPPDAGAGQSHDARHLRPSAAGKPSFAQDRGSGRGDRQAPQHQDRAGSTRGDPERRQSAEGRPGGSG